MDSSILRTWNGRTIRQREDGYLSLTDMAQATDKRVNDWQSLISTNEYLKAIESITTIPVIQLIQSRVGGNLPDMERGTWAHRKVAIRFAQWCSPLFAAQVDCWIEELLLKGYVAIADIALTEPLYLPPLVQVREAVDIAKDYKNIFGTINPQIEQHLKDLIGNVLIETNKATAQGADVWMGVVNFAEVEMGYFVPKKGTYRGGALGTWIRFYQRTRTEPLALDMGVCQHPELSDKQERRFCNETQRDIWVYPVHEVRDRLSSAVSAFFADPDPSLKLRLEGAFKRNHS